MFDHDRWTAISPYLDRALAMSDDDRRMWLQVLGDQHPAIAADLRELLDEHRALAQARFLEQGAAAVVGPALVGAGESVGSYRLLSPIGHGGMGSVWMAERSDGRFERRAAIKFLSIALVGRGEERFKREGRILARLVHRHIAQLLDAGVSTSGQPFLVLEHVDGEPIDRYCDSRSLDVDARVRLFLDVLSAVAHAHGNLIVHRDIKPSNVLVTREGHVKLLDFGIAKLLENEEQTPTLLTQEGAGVMTPAYAAPEQVTGALVSTSADIYALGVLLYVILSGSHPAGDRVRSPAELMKSIVEVEPPRASDAVAPTMTARDKVRRALRGDLDTIIATALRKEPRERYGSVGRFADDLQRHLRHEPIAARSDAFAYRTAKFVRRNLLPVGVVVLMLIGLSVGLYVVNRERAIAQQRFMQVRQLANKLFDIDVSVRRLPGSAQTRQLIVDTSLQYLRGLARDVRGDPGLALELGTAYMRVARVQGVNVSVNLGQSGEAEANLKTAQGLIETVLATQPDNRTAFVRLAQIAHDRMILASERRADDESLALAQRSADWLERYLGSGPLESSEAEQVVIALNNVSNQLRLRRRLDEALHMVRRGIELARPIESRALQLQVGGLLIGSARTQRDRGAIDDALKDIRDAAAILEPAPGALVQQQWLTFSLALEDEGLILANDRDASLGRPAEAIVSFRRAFQIADDIAHKDPNDAQSRGALAAKGRFLANLVRQSNAQEALDVYDHVRGHMAEVQNNPRFRRFEIQALAESTYALRRLGRTGEARQRLETALTGLRTLGLYPADQIVLGSDAELTLLASADLEADAGNPAVAAEMARSLLDRVLASQPSPEAHLPDASRLSRVYHAVAQLERRAGEMERASELDARRLRLWQHWDRKLPNNSYVAAQLQAIPR